MHSEVDVEQASLDLQFRRLYDAALPVVYGYLSLRLGGNRAVAEDLTSETFVSAVAEFNRGRADVVTEAWLVTVARRRLIDHWRRAEVADRKVVNLRPGSDPVGQPSLAERDAVERALGTLAEEQRAVLVLKHLEGYPVQTIASLLGRTPKAIESLLGRSRKAFRQAYEREAEL